MNAAALVITVACCLWIISFLIFSNVEIFQDLAASLFHDKKGGLPLVAIAIPLLVAAASILLLGRQYVPEGMNIRTSVALPHQIPARIQVLARCTLTWCQAPKTDPNFNVLAFIFVLLPSLKYLASSLRRHLNEIDKTDPDAFDQSVSEAADSFGMIAIILVSVFLLIPTTKHSAILSVMGWDPICAICLHIWAGRLLILATAIHGSLYMYRWSFIQNESILRLIVPPAACWTLRDSDFTPTCRENVDCTCYSLFRNLTGVLGCTALFAIGLTSMNSVRRTYFALFYRIHIIAGPLAFLMVICHYKRGMPYLAGGILYYLATSVPIWVEKYMIRRQGGTKIVSVRQIVSIGDRRSCSVMTIEASDSALARYRAGQYVRVTAPSIASAISHPFTINPVPGQPNQLCIIFRSTGKFTTALARSLQDGSLPTADKKKNGHSKNNIRPTLVIDGFYGSPNRTSQVLQHDVVVLVAGGVGITPFLTLLHKVYDSMNSNQGRGITRKVVLHWICREEGLYQYVKQVFFNPLLIHGNSAGVSMTLVVHLTGMTDSPELNDDPELLGDKNETWITDEQRPPQDGVALQETECIGDTDSLASRTSGVPFTPSKFAPMSKRSYRSNLLPFISLATSSVTGLCIVWYFYTKVQTDHTISTRMLSPLLVVMLTLSIGVATNLSKSYIYWLDCEEDFIAIPVTFTSVDKSNDKSFEMSNKLHNHNGMTTDAPESDANITSSSRATVNIEVNKGRPDVARLLRCLDHGMRPGVFLCGPESLVENVKQAVGRTSQCHNPPRCGSNRISLYEESFIL